MKNTVCRRGDVYFRHDHFLRDVGIQIHIMLEPLGIIPDHRLGDFSKDRLDEILDFCRRNPDFHVISFMPGGSIRNYASPDARWYCLGDGDPNPRLVARDPAILQSIAEGYKRTRSPKF